MYTMFSSQVRGLYGVYSKHYFDSNSVPSQSLNIRYQTLRYLARAEPPAGRRSRCIPQLHPPSIYKPRWKLEETSQSGPHHTIELSEAELRSSTLFRINTPRIQWMHQWSGLLSHSGGGHAIGDICSRLCIVGLHCVRKSYSCY